MGQVVNWKELRRLWEAATKGVFWQEEVAFSEACKVHLPAILDELEAAREALSQIYWKSIELGEDRGDSTINHIAADALKGDTSPLHARDRHTKLRGAAEELEELRNHCLECSGSGIEQSGVCHCGESMATHSKWDNHAALEMTRSCIFCKHLTERAAQLRQEAEDGK